MAPQCEFHRMRAVEAVHAVLVTEAHAPHASTETGEGSGDD
jgi:hypothetical protein